ncbi:hypothetical protein SAMN04487951_103254 [Vreelandella arcis]|uniref:Uncharacterized protein n=1 Tax=Vreelandella arcis TaxID=416873 RepID=A0A1G9ZW25_9GAMM|nr:hypothetical protein SAMN04487951_103254 [Halomonas arcis]
MGTTGHIQLHAIAPGINQHATLELLARLINESRKPCGILGRTLDLDAPERLTTLNDKIYLNLNFVAVVRKRSSGSIQEAWAIRCVSVVLPTCLGPSKHTTAVSASDSTTRSRISQG